MSWVSQLQLSHFRCYEDIRLDTLRRGPVILFGPNGAGKTNILESLSFLSPGRGLRGAKSSDILQQGCPAHSSWAVSSKVETRYGSTRIGTGSDLQSKKRIVRINGVPVKKQTALSEYLACVWLTPQMDRIFLEGAAARRRFLDRLVFAFDAAHSGRIIRYENAMRQRSKLLQEEQTDPAWLEGLESTMAETGTAVAAARLDFSERLQQVCEKTLPEEARFFPKATLTATGTVENLLRNTPAVDVEALFRYQLKETRKQDALTGATTTGPHRSDFSVYYATKDMPANQCSTGEQKALLIGIVLAHSRLIAAERGMVPVLLLDEVAAHLDEARRAGLYDLLLETGGQVWLTGTDQSLFSPVLGQADLFRIENATVHKDKENRAA